MLRVIGGFALDPMRQQVCTLCGDVLDERASEGDIHHLESATDAHRRYPAFCQGTCQGEFELVAQKVDPVHGRVLFAAVSRRVDVTAARHHDSVEPAEQMRDFCRIARREENRDATGSAHHRGVGGDERVCPGVAGGHGNRAQRSGDADDGGHVANRLEAPPGVYPGSGFRRPRRSRFAVRAATYQPTSANPSFRKGFHGFSDQEAAQEDEQAQVPQALAPIVTRRSNFPGVAGPLQSQSHLFDIPGDVAYLNCAYMPPLPRTVRDAGRRFLDDSTPWGSPRGTSSSRVTDCVSLSPNSSAVMPMESPSSLRCRTASVWLPATSPLGPVAPS